MALSTKNQADILRSRQHYAGLDIATFLVIENGKRPGIDGWQQAATTDDLQIESDFSDRPSANFGMPTEGMLVLDVDGCDNPWLTAHPSRRTSLFNRAAAVVQTPRGGLHFYFRMPAGRAYRNSAKSLAPNVDTRANGGFVVGAGSVVNGTVYRFLSGHELDTKVEKWNPPPSWLQSLLDGRGDSAAVVSAKTLLADGASEGGRNDYLTRFGGYLRRGGCDESELLAALQIRNTTKCTPPLPDSEVRQIAKSVANYEPDQIQELIIEGTEPAAAANNAIDPGPFPSRLLNVPGLLSKIAEYNLQGAFIRQPELALAGAIAFLGMLLGRKVQDEQLTRTNIYCVGLGGSGEGKDRSLKVSKDIASACGLSEQILGEPASSGGLIQAVAECPQALLLIDEIGRFLRSVQNFKSQPWLAEVVSILLVLFSSANSEFVGKRYAREKAVRIPGPHLSLYGVSVPQSVWGSMTVENMTDGFLSRLLIFEAAAGDPPSNRYPCVNPPDEDLITEVVYWRDYQPSGNLSHLSGQPRTLTYTAEVGDLFWKSHNDFRSLAKCDMAGSTLWTRALEKAKKLALIYQCSKDRKSELIEIEAARWGLDVVEHLTRRMIFQAGNWIADGAVGATKASILRFLHANGKQATTSQILRAHRDHNAKSMQDTLDTLALEGAIRIRDTQTGGRPARVYELVS